MTKIQRSNPDDPYCLVDSTPTGETCAEAHARMEQTRGEMLRPWREGDGTKPPALDSLWNYNGRNVYVMAAGTHIGRPRSYVICCEDGGEGRRYVFTIEEFLRECTPKATS